MLHFKTSIWLRIFDKGQSSQNTIISYLFFLFLELSLVAVVQLIQLPISFLGIHPAPKIADAHRDVAVQNMWWSVVQH